MDAGTIRDSYSTSLIRMGGTVGGTTDGAPSPQPAAPSGEPASDSASWPGQASSTGRMDHADRLRSLADDTVKQQYERDPDTKTLVYKAIDSATGTVLVQLPDESMLRMRLYLQSLQPQVSESTLTKSA